MSPVKSFRFAVVAALGAAVLVRADLKVGDAFPPLSATDVVNLAGGENPSLADKVTLVDFWASWCAPCKASFPALAQLHADYGSRGFQIIAVSIDERPAAAVAFWKKMAPPFVALHDRGQKLVQQVVVPTMPTSYLVDRKGRVRYVHAGFRGDLAEMRRHIEALLTEKS